MLPHCLGDVMCRLRGHERAERKSLRRQPLFLTDAVLDDVDGSASGVQCGARSHRVEYVGVDLFDLEGDDIALRCQLDRGVHIVEAGRDGARRDGTRGAGGFGIEYLDVVAHRARGERGHATQLPTAQESDGRAGQDRRARRDAHREALTGETLTG